MRSRWTPFFVTALIFNLFAASSAFSSEPYCLAIRGNGEAQPAHWGALASLVENKGLPSQQSGGSSGAISMFLLENIAANSWVTENTDSKEQASRASFMIKTIHGIANHFAMSPKALEAVDLSQFLKKHKAALEKVDMTTLNVILKAKNPAELVSPDRLEQIKSVAKTLEFLGVGETDPYSELRNNLMDLSAGKMPNDQEFKEIQFFSEDLKQAISTFGSFSAKSDLLFFREGLLSFPRFAKSMGRIATFLSGKFWDEMVKDPKKGVKESTRSAFEKFEADCRPGHLGKSWTTLSEGTDCVQKIGKIVDNYFRLNKDWDSDSNNVVFNNIGDTIPSFPSTSVLINSAYEEADKAMTLYYEGLDRTGAIAFKLDDSQSNDVKFGYWGNTSKLESIGKKLSKKDDAKSARFMNLGKASWLTALSASPAEPGLAPFQKITAQGKPAYSAGGWSDLHPVPVLKAAGCESVIYVTRKGGESLFAQGVAKRLLNFDRPWEELWTKDESKKDGIKLKNHQGDPSDTSSLWSQLYNVANPSSSYMKSVKQAHAIVCTDWDNKSSREDLVGIVEDGYQAPWVLQSASLEEELKGSPLTLLSVDQLSAEQVGCGYQP